MTLCGQTNEQLPHWMQRSGSQTATSSEMLRFSYAVVPLGYVPSTGSALTGSSSPRPAIIAAVTVRTNSGACVRHEGRGVVRGRDAPGQFHLVQALDQRASTAAWLRSTTSRAPAAVGLLDRRLDPLDRLLGLEHARDREEARLEDRVRAPREAGRAGDPPRVDDVELDPLLEHPLLDLARKRVPDLVRRVAAVEQQRRSRGRPVEHLLARELPELVAADEARARDEVRRPDGLRSEAQVRDGLRARLLRVVDEVALGVQALLGAEDLDRVLVRADRAVGAEAEEHRSHRVGRLDVERVVVREARVGHVVGDADREAPLGSLAGELVEHGGDHPRRELLRRQPVAAADHLRHQLALAIRVGLAQRREHVEEQRLAERSGLLGPVEHGDAARGGRQGRDQLLRRERAVEPDLCHADALAAGLQVAHRLARGLGAGAHQHEHALGLRVAAVVDEPVAAAGPLPELVHRPPARRRACGRRRG